MKKKYLFYLKEGENTITLEATLGDYGDQSVKSTVIDDLSELYLKIISICLQIQMNIKNTICMVIMHVSLQIKRTHYGKDIL